MPIISHSDGLVLAIVGEAPGEQEELQGQPFVGSSGQELDKLLDKHQILRSACFIGNVYPYRPPNNDIKAIDRTSQEWKMGVETLRRELLQVGPSLTLALGETALSVLTGRSGIMKWRGSLLPNILTGVGKVFPTLHPAYFLRQWKSRAIVDFDFGKAKRLAETGDFSLPQRHFVINPTFTEVISILKSLHNRTKLAVDFENTEDTGCPICLGLAPSKDFAVCIPFAGWSIEEEKQIWREIASLMANPNITKIFHNAYHDLLVFARWMHIVPYGPIQDTMLAFHNTYPELPKSLAFVASIFTNQPYWKDMHKESDEASDEKGWSRRTPKEKLYQYNCTDACVTFEVEEALQAELDDVGARAGYELDLYLTLIALEMTYKGIGFDKARAEKHLSFIQEGINSIDKVLEGVFKGVNTKSSKQMQELLYQTLGLPTRYKVDKVTGERRPTANEDALLELAYKHKTPQLLLLLKNRQLRTREAFVKFPIGEDGRVHPLWKPSSTETFRWAGGACFLGGRSLMNIPDWSRDIYCASPGKLLIGFDKQQAEARFVAYKGFICTGDSAYKDLIERGIKVHDWFLEQLSLRHIAPFSIEELSHQRTLPNEERSEEYGAWYFLAKKAVHAFSYGLGPISFSREVLKETSKSGESPVFVEVATAKRIKAALYDSISTIPRWQEAVQKHLRQNRTIVTSFGRCRLFLERWGESLFGEAYAYEPQATASGDDVNRSMIAIAEAMPNLEILHQNYDSMLAQIDEEAVQEAILKMKSLCQQPFLVWNFEHTMSIELTIPITIKVGKNWGDFDKERNPDGMKEVR